MASGDPDVGSGPGAGHEVDICGYSERGMINALFQDVRAAGTDPLRIERLLSLLDRCVFPRVAGGNPFRGRRFQGAKVRIEQSFSDFGDLDALVLLEEEGGESARHAVLIEAKVKTALRAGWDIRDEWRAFLTLLAQQASDSNLFVQLYRKLRLVRRITSEDELGISSIPSGWTLGSNPVVERAWRELGAYCANTWYLALVP